MRSAECGVRSVLVFAAFVAAHVVRADDKLSFTTETLRGHVVFLAEAFEKQTGVRSVPEAKERILALQTASGELIPLLEDVRARAFRRDQRLRDMDLELTVRRYRHVPTVQILRVLEVTKDGRYEIDYWCDICSIVLFENIECECCQGPVELRRRKVD